MCFNNCMNFVNWLCQTYCTLHFFIRFLKLAHFLSFSHSPSHLNTIFVFHSSPIFTILFSKPLITCFSFGFGLEKALSSAHISLVPTKVPSPSLTRTQPNHSISELMVKKSLSCIIVFYTITIDSFVRYKACNYFTTILIILFTLITVFRRN